MEEVQGESGIFDSWRGCWMLEKQEGYTVPDFVRQIETAWRKLNNITTPKKPGEDEWE
jgi:hypothetical protein